MICKKGFTLRNFFTLCSCAAGCAANSELSTIKNCFMGKYLYPVLHVSNISSDVYRQPLFINLSEVIVFECQAFEWNVWSNITKKPFFSINKLTHVYFLLVWISNVQNKFNSAIHFKYPFWSFLRDEVRQRNCKLPFCNHWHLGPYILVVENITAKYFKF